MASESRLKLLAQTTCDRNYRIRSESLKLQDSFSPISHDLVGLDKQKAVSVQALKISSLKFIAVGEPQGEGGGGRRVERVGVRMLGERRREVFMWRGEEGGTVRGEAGV